MLWKLGFTHQDGKLLEVLEEKIKYPSNLGFESFTPTSVGKNTAELGRKYKCEVVTLVRSLMQSSRPKIMVVCTRAIAVQDVKGIRFVISLKCLLIC